MDSSFYPFSLILIECFFTFVMAPIACYLSLSALLQVNEEDRKRLLVLSIGVGPITIAWLLILLLLALPGLSSGYYIAIINLVFLIPLVLFRKQLWSVPNYLLQGVKGLMQDVIDSKLYLFIYILALLLMIGMFFLSIYLPFVANDPIEYAMIAKVMAIAHSARMYPILSGADYGGLIAPYTHGLAYVGSMVWAYLIQGTAQHFGLARLVSPFFALSTFVVIVYFLRERNRLLAILAGLMYLATPMLLHGFIQHQIEAIRLYSFFAFFMFLPIAMLKPSWRSNVVAGFLLGLCLFSHSLGILAIPLFVVIYFMHVQPVSNLRKIGNCLSIIIIGVLCVLPRYSINLSVFGHLLQDNTSIRAMPSLHYLQINAINEQITTIAQKWLNGFLSLFYHFSRFGIAYLILLFALLLLNRTLLKNFFINKGIVIDRYKEGMLSVAILVVLGYIGMIALSIVLNMQSFITNARYMVTAQPFVAIVAAWVVVTIFNNFLKKYAQHFIVGVALLVIFMPAKMIFSDIYSYNLSPYNLLDNDYTKASSSSPIYGTISIYNQLATPKDKLFSFTNGQTAFAVDTAYIFRTDNRLKPLYHTTTAEQANDFLHSLGLNYVILPQYQQLFITQTPLNELFGEPKFSELLVDKEGAQLIRLHKQPLKYSMERIHIPNDHFNQKYSNNQLKHWYITSKDITFLQNNGIIIRHSSPRVKKSIFLYSGKADPNQYISDLGDEINIKPNHRYRLTLQLKGKGIFRVFLALYQNNKEVYLKKIGRTFTLYSGEKLKTIPLQFLTTTPQVKYRLVFSFQGMGWVNLRQIKLDQITYSSAQQGKQHQRAQILTNGWEINTQKWISRVLHPIVAFERFAWGILKDSWHRLEYFIASFNAQEYGKPLSNGNYLLRAKTNSDVVLEPKNSQIYMVRSPKIKVFPTDQAYQFYVNASGKGYFDMQLRVITKKQNDYALSEKNHLLLTKNMKSYSIKISHADVEQKIKGLSREEKIYLQITYRRPTHTEPGLICLADYKVNRIIGGKLQLKNERS